MTKPILANHNALSLLDSGIWVKADAADRSFIDYTDGESTENKVYVQVEAASDRSVYSDELDRAWPDWALEYHLGSRRSNIYRGLNLEGVKTVLEVGCGCGAITRFLGEQGFHVDAIEGTQNRAEIARLRTSDLENVQIVCSNYHELVLPATSYDLVVFTGVLEYSGAYAPEGVSPEAQLKHTIRHAQAALSETGQIVIAIENRTGFKYLAGAGEDHLNVPNIGLYGYVEPLSQPVTRGIRTWSKLEWSRMLEEFGFEAFEFCYPFPDYKIPDAILSDQYLESARHPEQVLGGISSRDYAMAWEPKLTESLFWQTAAQTGSLDEFANSFLIVAGNSADRVRAAIGFDFVRFASMTRKLPYRLQVRKNTGEAQVQRVAVDADAVPGNEVVSQFRIQNEPFIDGQVLEALWRQALSVVPSHEELAEHIRAYSGWLEGQLEQGADKFVDALPGNIIVDDQGLWHLIDQEWHAVESIGKEVILFRALFQFVIKTHDLVSQLDLQVIGVNADTSPAAARFSLIQTFDDFIDWGLALCGIGYEECRESCIDFEMRLQHQVTRPEYVRDLKDILKEPIFQENFGQSMEVRAYWTQIDNLWHPDHSVFTKVSCSSSIEAMLELPEMLCSHRYLRINLASDLTVVVRERLALRKLAISVNRESGEQECVYRLASTGALVDKARLTGLRNFDDETLMLTSTSGSIVLDLSGVEWGNHVTSLELSLELDVLPHSDALRERQWLRDELHLSARRIRVRQHILDSQQERLDDGNRRLALLEKKIKQSSTTTLGRLLGRFGLMRKFRV